jgi:hypothetical protein
LSGMNGTSLNLSGTNGTSLNSSGTNGTSDRGSNASAIAVDLNSLHVVHATIPH